MLKKITECMKPVSYPNEATIIEDDKPLQMMFFVVKGKLMETAKFSVDGDIQSSCDNFCGVQLVYWLANWASNSTFSAELPLSTCSVCVADDNGAEVLLLWADDLKSIVSEYRLDFMKQTNVRIDSEGKLLTFDPLTRLTNVSSPFTKVFATCIKAQTTQKQKGFYFYYFFKKKSS